MTAAFVVCEICQ